MTLLQAFSAGLTPRLWPPRSAANPFRQFSVHPPPPMVVAASQKNPSPDPNPSPSPNPSPEASGGTKTRRGRDAGGDPVGELYPATIPRKPRRGRRGEAAAVEDFVRGSLERTFAEIRKQNSQLLDDKEEVLKASPDILERESGSEVLVEEDDPDWPADAEIGWGVRASEYFERHPIKNVVDGGVEIDWEGEMEEGLVKEINCLEWESFAFHPSPLVVLVFERYNRAGENWKFLMELEKAAEVYWKAKDRLPPRTVKIDMNIERDLAYALKVRECPQLLFLRGNRILYREKELRTAEELVQMIAHFYYNARRPTWVDPANVAPY